MGQPDDSDSPEVSTSPDGQDRAPLTWGVIVARTIVGVAGVLGGLAVFFWQEEQFRRAEVLEFAQTYLEMARQDPGRARQELVTEDFIEHWASEPAI